MRHFNQRFRKGIAVLLLLSMVYSLVPNGLLATESNAPPESMTTYTIIYDGNGIAAEDELMEKSELSLAEGEPFDMTLPKATYQREGYLFIGWSTTKDNKDEMDEEDKDKVLTKAIFVPDEAELKDFVFKYDKDDNGEIDEADESFDLRDSFKAEEDKSRPTLTLYAQWQKVEANDAKETVDAPKDTDLSIADKPKSNDEATSSVDKGAAVIEAPTTNHETAEPSEEAKETNEETTAAPKADTTTTAPTIERSLSELTSDAPALTPSQGGALTTPTDSVKPTVPTAGLSLDDSLLAPTVQPSADGSLEMTPMPLLSAPMLVNRMMALTAPSQPPTPTEGQVAEEGTTIGEGTRLEWITPDSFTVDVENNPDLLSISRVGAGNSPFFMKMRLNVALSSEEYHPPGSVVITLPKTTMFHDRQGDLIGKLVLSVPKAPDDRQTFAYTEEEDCYRITNVRDLLKAEQPYFEFSIENLVPSKIEDYKKIPDGKVSDPFYATIDVTLANGTKLTYNTNHLTARLDTQSHVYNAHKNYISVNENWNVSWPSELKPVNDGDYIYVDWFTYCLVRGNQNASLTLTDDASHFADGTTIDGAIVLGYQRGDDVFKNEANTSTFTHTLGEDGNVYFGDSISPQITAYVAYPKSNFKDLNKLYSVKNTITYTMTDADDGYTTHASEDAVAPYSPAGWIETAGHFDVFKQGEGENSIYYENLKQGIYETALNALKSKQDVDLSYRIRSIGYGYLWTNDPNDGKTIATRVIPDDYGKKSITYVTEDYRRVFSGIAENLTTDDYEFRSLRFDKPKMYEYKPYPQTASGVYEAGGRAVYGTIAAGEYGYLESNDESLIPAIRVEVKYENTGDWTPVATQPIKTAASNSVTSRLVCQSTEIP